MPGQRLAGDLPAAGRCPVGPRGPSNEESENRAQGIGSRSPFFGRFQRRGTLLEARVKASAAAAHRRTTVSLSRCEFALRRFLRAPRQSPPLPPRLPFERGMLHPRLDRTLLWRSEFTGV